MAENLKSTMKAAAIPGFIYDESRQRYFRCPASHLTHNILPIPTISTSPITGNTCQLQRYKSVHSLFNIIRQREYATPPQNFFQCYKTHCHSLLCNLKRSSVIETDLTSSFGYQLTDCAITPIGDLLAMSYVKEVQSSENPVCYKRAYVVKVIDERFRFEEVNIPLGVMKASSLQPCRGVNLKSYGGCNRIVVYSDRFVEMAKLDEHHQSVQVTPLKRMPMGAITTVALNPIESNCSLALGYESGNIELLKECSSNNSLDLLHGKNSSVLSLAFSEQRPLLYAGHRNGGIILRDLRRQKSVVTMWEQKIEGVSSSIISIHPLLDDNYFICSAFNSKLSLWDLRLQKAVLAFGEHINDYKCCQCLVDKAESLLISVGSDACIRIWILHTGELVRCIEPSEYGVRGSYNLPTICYSETLGGQQFNPSLLVGTNKKMVQFRTQT